MYEYTMRDMSARAAATLQAMARTYHYLRLPPKQLPVAPDAQHFPGLSAAGTVPLGAVSVQVSCCPAAQLTALHACGLLSAARQP